METERQVFLLTCSLTAVLHHKPVELNAAVVVPAALLAVDVSSPRHLPLLEPEQTARAGQGVVPQNPEKVSYSPSD